MWQALPSHTEQLRFAGHSRIMGYQRVTLLTAKLQVALRFWKNF